MEGGCSRLEGKVPRQKTYSAQNGYVYQYQFSGQTSTETGTHYVFHVWSQGAALLEVTLMLEDSVAEAWEAQNQFLLTETQRYAMAKMAFFQALDEGPGPRPPPGPIAIRREDLAAIAVTLNLI